MPAVNWEAFARLPGAADVNFEKLCRAIMRRHYGQFGDFQELANQAGVEFHLKLHTACDLGDPPRWFGWQCKWYGISNGQNLGKTRRDKIVEGLNKSKKYLPGLTDWVLWTKHTLTKADQKWYYGLASVYPGVKLALNTSDDVELLLSGVAANLRESYFGELVITPQTLADQYKVAAAPYRHRYQPEVHHVVPTEEALLRCQLSHTVWISLCDLADRLNAQAGEIKADFGSVPTKLHPGLSELLTQSAAAASVLKDIHDAIRLGDIAAIKQLSAAGIDNPQRHRQLVARLRSARSPCALVGANLLADIYAADSELAALRDLVEIRAAAVLAPAGAGKSELSLRLTCPTAELLGGVILFGKDLHAGQDLDDLVRSFKIGGKAAQSFEQFVEAVDAAGQRAGKRLPVVIDGLNEAEDPRDWKEPLFRADELLKRFPHVLLIVTLRDQFSGDCLPEGMSSFAMNGFEDNPRAAIDKYFEHYKIDATDGDLPLEFLQHPLTLRIYCEVANPERKHLVGVEALPRSMSALFSEYFRRLVARVAAQSPSSRRLYQDEVLDALRKLGEELWERGSRGIEQRIARKSINDADSWNESLLRSLESEGVLIRLSNGTGRFGVAFTYDLMAGHVIAEYLLYRDDIAEWFSSPANISKLSSGDRDSHPLATDIFGALAGLFPVRKRGRQLWQVLPTSLVSSALLLSAKGDPAHINRETVDRFSDEMIASSGFAQAAYPLLRVTRAASAHPFDADFLDGVLRRMTNSARDLSWSEWLRKNDKLCRKDVIDLNVKWARGGMDRKELARARWVMWMLTTTSRYLRDLSTKALHTFALAMPEPFYELALKASTISDPYVPERAFAAAYGAALSAWSDESNTTTRSILPIVARSVFISYFSDHAVTPTRHALFRQYCLGIIALARRIDSSCLSHEEAKYLEPPFSHLPSPFDKPPRTSTKKIEAADDEAISMDFGNYTIGRLVADRSNYDFKNTEYVKVRKAIVVRMLQLGYDPELFQEVDKTMWSSSRHDEDGTKVDRYGKKYGWIAYFEMWGVRSDNNLLSEWRGDERTVDADIDPTFLGAVKSWDPVLPELFVGSPQKIAEWIVDGPVPDYGSLLQPSVVDDVVGDWVLLEGFLEETAKTDYRNVFTFMRGILVERDQVSKLKKVFDSMEYPGNDAIASVREQYYKYAGEMPFDSVPGIPSSVTDSEQKMVSTDRWTGNGVPVEVPVHVYSWESYHSKLNPESGAFFPSPAICQATRLGFRPYQWDLYDQEGVGSLYRRLKGRDDSVRGRIAYVRADLLDQYLEATNKALVWLIWGERGEHYRGRSGIDRDLYHVYDQHKHIHKYSEIRIPRKSRAK